MHFSTVLHQTVVTYQEQRVFKNYVGYPEPIVNFSDCWTGCLSPQMHSEETWLPSNTPENDSDLYTLLRGKKEHIHVTLIHIY